MGLAEYGAGGEARPVGYKHNVVCEYYIIYSRIHGQKSTCQRMLGDAYGRRKDFTPLSFYGILKITVCSPCGDTPDKPAEPVCNVGMNNLQRKTGERDGSSVFVSGEGERPFPYRI